MKSQYEDRARFLLPRRTYTVIRCDGKAFHTFTRRCDKPYDYRLSNAMVDAAVALCEEAQGCCFGYLQSDEISVVLQDFATIHTCAWFDGNVQKIASVAASTVSAAFNRSFYQSGPDPDGPPAVFDARVFTIPDPVEVENYFIWRQQDATRNSVQSMAQAHFSPKQLHGQSQSDLHELLHGIGLNWNDCPVREKRGVGIVRSERGWATDLEIPVWTQDRAWLTERIPRIWPVEEQP